MYWKNFLLLLEFYIRFELKAHLSSHHFKGRVDVLLSLSRQLLVSSKDIIITMNVNSEFSLGIRLSLY